MPIIETSIGASTVDSTGSSTFFSTQLDHMAPMNRAEH